jgi:AraC-like DNA-binding protein
MAPVASIWQKLRMRFDSAELLYTGQVEPRKNWSIPLHSHAYHQLIVPIRGRIHVRILNRDLTAACGELLWYAAGVAHAERSDPGDPVETLFFGFSWPDAPADLPALVADRDGRGQQLAKWLRTNDEVHADMRAEFDVSFLRALVVEYVRLATHDADPLIARVRGFMRRNLAKPLTLPDLAAHARMSRYHFVRKYRQLTGRTPMNDLREMRLQAAREMILTTDSPLKEVAPACGLTDEYHLSRSFRRYLDTTPGALRR